MKCNAVSLLMQHNIERRIEDNFVRILEKLKYFVANKMPLRCSKMQYRSRFEDLSARHVSRIRALETSTSIYSCLYSKELIKPKVFGFQTIL